MATTVTLKPNAIDLSGSTSGTTTLQATAVAGTTTITLPAATDTLVGKATTDTLTNKTLTTPVISSLSSASATALTLQSAGTTAITVSTAQNVGIGTTSPSYKLHAVKAGGGVVGRFDNGDGITDIYGYGLEITRSAAYIKSSGALQLGGANGYNDLVIDSSGNFLAGTTNASLTVGEGFKFFNNSGTNPYVGSVMSSSTNSQTNYHLYSTGAGAYRFYVGMGGTIFATSIVITAISDQRLKENVRDIDTGLNSIMALKPRRFDWKEGKGQNKKNVAGFIAQEFEEVFPECVSTSKAGGDGIEYKNINHETLIPTLVKAIQELKAEFDAYKATHP